MFKIAAFKYSLKKTGFLEAASFISHAMYTCVNPSSLRLCWLLLNHISLSTVASCSESELLNLKLQMSFPL